MNICNLPDELLEIIFLYLKYNNDLYLVCKKFHNILIEMDYRNYLLMKNNNKSITSILRETYLFHDIMFKYNKFRFDDLKTLLYSIENLDIELIIRKIKKKYKISVNDIYKIVKIILIEYKFALNSHKYLEYGKNEFQRTIIKALYDNLFNLNCFLILTVKSFYNIVNTVYNMLNEDFFEFNDLLVEINNNWHTKYNNIYYLKKIKKNTEYICKYNSAIIWDNRFFTQNIYQSIDKIIKILLL